jgi:glycosidase
MQWDAGAALSDDRSVFHHYRRLIALRRTEPAVAHGDFTRLAIGHPMRALSSVESAGRQGPWASLRRRQVA